MTTITAGAATTTPDLVRGWASSRPSRSVVHDVIAKPEGDVTLRDAGPRTGTLRLFYADHAAALAAEQMHAPGRVYVLTPDPGDPLPAMSYVVVGDVTLSSWTDDGEQWLVEVGYRERP